MSGAGYHERPRREMLPFVPREARRVLDVGCGGGAFARELKRSRPGLEVWGVEPEPAAAARAETVLDRVVVGTAPDALHALGEARFDCIVMNDVIEHVADPDALLAGVRQLVAPEGRLVASIPNVRHHATVADLVLHGRWEYVDEGILDRTHLRFYTRGSMTDLFTRCGFDVLSVTGINRTGSRVFRLLDLLTWRRFTDMGYLQFACVVAPGPEKTA